MLVRVVVACCLLLGVAHARVDRIQIVSQQDIPSDPTFQAVGPYERLRVRVFYALDPKQLRNRGIVDLDKAPRNARGEVEFSGEAVIVRPKRAVQGNDVVLVNVINRGQRFLGQDKPTLYFLRQGYTLVDLAWQFDARDDPALLKFEAPIAKGVRGQVRSDFVVPARVAQHTVGHLVQGVIGGTGYAVADRRGATLTERDGQRAPRRTIPPTRWSWVDDRTIKLEGDFVPGKVYEVIYTAADPAVVGVGLAAIRDFVAHCKTDPSSPARAKVAYGMGISQTGRVLRQLVWQGFNADEAGKQVFDGLLVYVAGAGRGDSFNQRFAQPSRDAQPLAPFGYPVDLYPFTDEPTPDGAGKAGLLDRAKADRVVPKIFYINTSYEYWSRGSSLIHTTPDGKADVAPPPTTRIYALAGFGHVGGKFPPELDARPEFRGQQLVNPNNMALFSFAMTAALDAWVRDGVEPPPSRYPKIADGTLVRPSQLARKTIEGAAVPSFAYEPPRLAGAGLPPQVTGSYVALVPQIGADGNELAGVRVPDVEVPVGAFTGWNLRHADIGFPTYRTSYIGAFIPWPKATVLSKYPDKDTYLGRYTAAALAHVEQRFLLPEFLPIMLARARAFYELAVK